MPRKEFIFQKTVYVGSTNMFGNVYFARYFDWQGEAREAFFHKVVPESLAIFRSGVKFLTLEATVKYHKEAKVFDDIIIKVKAENFKITTFDLTFVYLKGKDGKLIAIGKQKIGFVDSKGKIIPIPREVLQGWSRFTKTRISSFQK